MAERWYEITGYFDSRTREEIDADGIRIIVKGSIDDVVIVQVPSVLRSEEAHRIMQSVQSTLTGAGVDRPLVLMPDHIKFMKVRKLSAKETSDLKAANASVSAKGAMH